MSVLCLSLSLLIKFRLSLPTFTSSVCASVPKQGYYLLICHMSRFKVHLSPQNPTSSLEIPWSGRSIACIRPPREPNPVWRCTHTPAKRVPQSIGFVQDYHHHHHFPFCSQSVRRFVVQKSKQSVTITNHANEKAQDVAGTASEPFTPWGVPIPTRRPNHNAPHNDGTLHCVRSRHARRLAARCLASRGTWVRVGRRVALLTSTRSRSRGWVTPDVGMVPRVSSFGRAANGGGCASGFFRRSVGIRTRRCGRRWTTCTHGHNIRANNNVIVNDNVAPCARYSVSQRADRLGVSYSRKSPPDHVLDRRSRQYRQRCRYGGSFLSPTRHGAGLVALDAGTTS